MIIRSHHIGKIRQDKTKNAHVGKDIHTKRDTAFICRSPNVKTKRICTRGDSRRKRAKGETTNLRRVFATIPL